MYRLLKEVALGYAEKEKELLEAIIGNMYKEGLTDLLFYSAPNN